MEAPVARTQRLVPYMFVAASVALIGAVFDESLIALSVFMVSVAVFMRGYAVMSAAAASRLTVSVRVRAGAEDEDVLVVFDLVNPTRVPIAVAEYSLYYSPLLRFAGPSRAGLFLVPPRGSTELKFMFRGRVGTYRVGPLKISVRDPLGLFRSSDMEVFTGTDVSILPKVETAVVKRLWTYTRSSGLVKSRHPGEGVELFDIREYRPGDELRRVVWRVFSSRGVLAVKELERETSQYVLFVVDSTKGMWVGPPRQTPAEHFARIVASIAYYLCRRGYKVAALVFNERSVHSSGSPAAGAAGFRWVYGTLARIEYLEEPPDAALLEKIVQRVVLFLPRERTTIFVFTRPSEEGREDLILRLHELLRDRGHKLFVVTPIVVSYELADVPRWSRTAYAVKLYEFLKKDLDSLDRLRKHGVRTIAVSPTHVPQRVVRAVEELA